MEMEMTTPIPTAAMATVIIEPEKRSRMMSPLAFSLLLERILFNADKIRGVVFCRRVGTSPLFEGEIFCARCQHHRREGVISFNAARFVINSVLLVTLLGELLF